MADQGTAYQQRAAGNAARTATVAAAVLAAHRAGQVDRSQLPAYLTAAIRSGAARAVTLADLALASLLAATIHRPVPTVGLTLPEETAEQIEAGVLTVTEDEPDEPDDNDDEPEDAEDDEPEDDEELDERVARLARAAPLQAGQQAYGDALQAQGVGGWTRRTDPDPCPICRALADGRVIPASTRMIVPHPECGCAQVPVLTGAKAFQRPEDGPDDPATFTPHTVRTGHGLHGHESRRVSPILTIERSKFIPAAGKRRPGR